MIYLDNAATTFPKPQCVIDVVTHTLSNGFATPGRGKYSTALKANLSVSSIRKNYQKFFGMLEDYRIVFTYSATDSLNSIIKGFIEEGDHLIISNMEHNSVSRQVIRLAQAGYITFDIAKTDDKGYIDIDNFKSIFNSRTKLVILSHASNVTGAVQNIAELTKITHEFGGYILIDAAQTAGIVPINVKEIGIDFLAFSGHKGLMGVQGTGGFVIGERVNKLRPFREGGTGFDSESETQPKNWPEAYESGTPNVLGILSMGAGLDFINEVGIDNIANTELKYIEKIYSTLSENKKITIYSPNSSESRVGVLSFNIAGWDSTDIGDILDNNHGISVRCGIHCSPLAHKRLGTFPAGTVRVSPSYFTTEKDIDVFLNAIKTISMVNVPIY